MDIKELDLNGGTFKASFPVSLDRLVSLGDWTADHFVWICGCNK